MDEDAFSVSEIANAVKTGSVLDRTVNKYNDPIIYTKEFNDQLIDQIKEMDRLNMCKLIPGSTSINWMSIPSDSIHLMTSYQKWIYYSCMVASMRKDGISSDLILHSLSSEFSFLGAGIAGTVGISSKDDNRPRTSSDIVMKSTSNNDVPTDLIHELFVGVHLNQLDAIGVPNFVKMYGYTASCNTPFVTKDGKISPGCERQGSKVSILLEKIDNSVTFNKFVQDHVNGDNLISTDENEAVTILLEVFLQIFAALSVAQKQMKFMHVDLHTSNILIVEHDLPIETTYQMGNRLLTIKSRYQPIIIDFGMSRISIGCKMYVDRMLIYKGISKPDILEGAFIPWHDNFRLLAVMVSRVLSDTTSLLNKMICHLFMMTYEGSPSSVKEVIKPLPTVVSPIDIHVDTQLFDTSTQSATSIVEDIVDNRENIGYQSTMADYDLNTPECMVRMMMVNHEVYQFLSMSATYGDTVDLFNTIVPRSGEFGTLEGPILTSLIDLKQYVKSHIRTTGVELSPQDGVLSEWKSLVVPSVQSFNDAMKRVLAKGVDQFDLTVIVDKSTMLRGRTRKIKKFIADSEIIYDYQSTYQRVLNWRTDILVYLNKIDPTLFDGELDEFNTLFNKLSDDTKMIYSTLENNYYEAIVIMEDIVNNDQFMLEEMSSDDRSHLIKSRQEVKDKQYDFGKLRNDGIVREYYLSTYVKSYNLLLGMLYSDRRANSVRANNVMVLINTIIDRRAA